jgi:hypothetical protein
VSRLVSIVHSNERTPSSSRYALQDSVHAKTPDAESKMRLVVFAGLNPTITIIGTIRTTCKRACGFLDELFISLDAVKTSERSDALPNVA